MVASEEIQLLRRQEGGEHLCMSKGIHALALIAFLLGLATLARAYGCCALAAGLKYDDGLYTVGLECLALQPNICIIIAKVLSVVLHYVVCDCFPCGSVTLYT